jgi:hypothetical protein
MALATMAIVLLVPSAFSATAFATDFDADQSANFVSLQTSPVSPALENPIDFTYDYSTYVATGLPATPTANAVDTIVPAPNGPATTIGVFMQCNIGGNGIASSAQIQTNAIFAGDVTASVDAFSMHNGKAGGAGGSTIYFGLGLFGDATVAMGQDGITGGPGIIYTNTGDGGSSADVRVAVDGVNQATGFLASYGANNTDSGWVALYPNNAVADVGGDDVSGEVLAGAPGKQWVVIDVTYTDGTDTFDVSFDGTPVYSLVGTGVGDTFGSVALTYSDRFNSIANPAGDQFQLYDNLSINATVPVELSILSTD